MTHGSTYNVDKHNVVTAVKQNIVEQCIDIHNVEQQKKT